MAGAYVPTLRELALLADGSRSAIVGPHGDLLWLCFPRHDSPSLFTGLVGGAGTYAITPQGRYTWGGYYEDASLIWRSRWMTEGGVPVESRDALAFPGEAERAVLLRQITARGKARLQVRLDPRPDFGRAQVSWRKDETQKAWVGRCGSLRLRWWGALDAKPDAGGLTADLEVKEGEPRDLVLELSLSPLEQAGLSAEHLWQQTARTWEQRVPSLPAIPARRDARHAVAVMTGLRSSSGGIVAAATTSLPERTDSGRDFDYRYVWIRDQSYAGHAAAEASVFELLDCSVRFVRERLLEDGAELRPAYTVDGATLRGEQPVSHLSGYPGGHEVLVGNDAGDQFQLDAFGEALVLFATAGRHDRLERETVRAMQIAAQAIKRRWREKNAGIWETEPRRWTHGRLICAAGLRQAAPFMPSSERSRWLELADQIVEETARRALDPRTRCWRRADDDDRLDASLVIPPVRGALAASDSRTRATLSAVLSELSQDGYTYRYRADDRPLGEAEGAFNLCNFWVVLALLQQGQVLEAARRFERARAACGPPGLFAEEYDVAQREMRGNLPQMFVHAELLECAARLAGVLD